MKLSETLTPVGFSKSLELNLRGEIEIFDLCLDKEGPFLLRIIILKYLFV